MTTISLQQPPNFIPPRMSDHFWANDNTALNNILERLLKSKRTCETILKIAQIEQDYGERLLKLSQIRLSESEEPSSTFSETLQSIPTATEAAARAHIDLAQQIHHLLETPLSAFIKEQKAVRKSTMAEIDKIQNLRYMHLDNVKRSREAYMTECNKLKNYEGDRQGDELMQIKQKTATVDHEYKLSVGILESVTNNWIEEWKKSCNTFQELEEKRLSYLSGTLLAYANMISNVYTIDDQSCDRIKGGLDNLSIAADIYTFIHSKGTGSTVPEIPKYTCHHDFDQAPELSVQTTPRTVREINIPVKDDEELRSVSDQLRKLPSTRTHTLESTKDQESPSSLTKPTEDKTEEIPKDQTIRDKALPPPPPPAQTNPNNESSTFLEIQPPQVEKATIQRSPATIPYPHEPLVVERPTPQYPPLPSSTTITTPSPQELQQQRKSRDFTSPVIDYESRISANNTSPVHTTHTANNNMTHHITRNAGFLEQQHPKSLQQQHQEYQQHQQQQYQQQQPVHRGDDPTLLRKGKKKNKPYAVFPFLKKKSDDDSGGKPRFSLGLLGPKKDDKKSPTNSSHTSPQSLSFPDHHTYTSSAAAAIATAGTPPPPFENRFNTIASKLALEDGTPVLEYVKAQWSYDAKIESEITFSKNDILAVIEKKRDGWWDAQIVHSDKHVTHPRGLVPGNFMETYS
ncbi:hypothetical protein BDA99DRAFT_555917 [Phascolomyces articulosus]|uniref:SH3 domain-containing protein n=1 Tax=Phascolomyces articulosus TaxID=60185 RepID=A0AAD5KKZ6_9FUNG|nr:hypothetical protein BDA99DRAFT_555917 [Phascolomyces articulosus]